MIIFLKHLVLLAPGIFLSFVIGRIHVNIRDKREGLVGYAFGPRFWLTSAAVAILVPIALQLLFQLFTFLHFNDDWTRGLSLGLAGGLYGYVHGQRPGMAPLISLVAGILGGVACWSLYPSLERAHLDHLAIPLIFCTPPLVGFEFYDAEERFISWARVVVPQGGILRQ